ncbi:hypothetical protein ACQPW3_11320 [Actinosynnema sp. CA-248983]
MRVAGPIKAVLGIVAVFAAVASCVWWESGELDRRLARVVEQVTIKDYRLAKQVEAIEYGRKFVTAYYVGPTTENTINLVSGMTAKPSGPNTTKSNEGMDIPVATGLPENCFVSVDKHDRTNTARPPDSGVTEEEWARERSGELDVLRISMLCDRDSEAR